MTKKITQLNVIELKDGVRIAIRYSVFREDGSLYSNNNKISMKITEGDMETQNKLDDFYNFILQKF